MLEDELTKVWAVGLTPASDSAKVARMEYDIAKSPEDFFKKRECTKTLLLMRERVLEALSSPSPYMREWGRLIVAEQKAEAKQSIILRIRR